MRRMLCLLCLLALLPGCAAALGRTYADFETLYAENIAFLNQNVQRHLLPHTPKRDYDTDGKRLYRIVNGALDVEIHMDQQSEQIASCRITLTAPSSMPYGSPQHLDFSVSGYHSYALLMAMAPGDTPYERYALVQQVSDALAAGDTFDTYTWDYHLTCTREERSVTMLFENKLLMEKKTEAPVETELPSDEEDNALLG